MSQQVTVNMEMQQRTPNDQSTPERLLVEQENEENFSQASIRPTQTTSTASLNNTLVTLYLMTSYYLNIIGHDYQFNQ